MTPKMPGDFIESTSKKVEQNGLGLPITPDELEKLCAGDPHSEQALEDMLQYALRYALDVWNMKLFTRNRGDFSDSEWAEKLAKIDNDRTQLHNTYIESIGILSRALMRAERDNNWVKALAPTGTLDRATCGKFAIMLSYWLSVNERR
jgi:hypothetical protein